MKALFFISLTLFFIVIQTVVLPTFSWFVQCFDLVIINILFLSLISSRHSMIFAIITIGCIMDSISGVPFCYHVFSYIWIYIIVYLAKQLLFKKSKIFIFIISAVSVFIQHGLLLFSVFVNQGSNAVLEFNFGLLMRQVFWGFVFIPPCLGLVNAIWHNWNFAAKLIQKQMAQKDRG